MIFMKHWPPAFLPRRPRIYNALHSLYLVPPFSETQPDELDCLARYAKGTRVAIEIGTFMGVSAARIANALADDGKLWCVDPYFGGEALRAVCLRHLRRQQLLARVVMVRLISSRAASCLPTAADFIFIDGDHSWRGIETDWSIVLRHLVVGGVVCLHDTNTRPEQPDEQIESVKFFERLISKHPAFEHVETCRTLNVLRRCSYKHH